MSKDSIELALSVMEAEKANLSPEQLQRLAELTEAGEDVRESVTETLEAKEKRELTAEQADQLLATLKTRFESSNKRLRKAVDFSVAEKSLRLAPEKLYALHKLEETGGEPQLIGIDGDEFIFEDRSAESPSGRRDLDFDQSLKQAEEFGVDMQSPEAYKAMQETGKYDLKSWSWLKTDPKYREDTGNALDGRRDDLGVYVCGIHAENRFPADGWRASLRVIAAGEGVRSDVTDTLKVAEKRELTPELAVYHQEYSRLPADVKSRATWEAIAQKLLADDSKKLKLAKNMQGGGELVGIDSGGKALFKDKGVEPVIFGFDGDGKLVHIYDRDQEQIIKQIKKWADYSEIRGQILKDGYELFPYEGDYDCSDEMKQVENHTKEPFVASKNREEWRVSWLESGDCTADARRAYFDPAGGRVGVGAYDPEHRYDGSGAVRLLRV